MSVSIYTQMNVYKFEAIRIHLEANRHCQEFIQSPQFNRAKKCSSHEL